MAHIWNEIPVLVTFESNWEKAKALLEQVINNHAPRIEKDDKVYDRKSAHRFVITYDNVAPTVYSRVASSGVLLTMRYLIAPRQRRNSEQKIWEAVLHAFQPHVDIDFAYETVREFRHWREGRPAVARQEQELSSAPIDDHREIERD